MMRKGRGGMVIHGTESRHLEEVARCCTVYHPELHTQRRADHTHPLSRRGPSVSARVLHRDRNKRRYVDIHVCVYVCV